MADEDTPTPSLGDAEPGAISSATTAELAEESTAQDLRPAPSEVTATTTTTSLSDSVVVPRWILFLAGGLLAAIVLIVGGILIANLINASIREAEAAEAAAIAQQAAEQAAAKIQDRHDNLFADAVNACEETSSLGGETNVRDGGKSLALDGGGGSDFTNYLAWEHQQCILKEIEVPSSILDRMGGTRALDGTQEGEWDDLIVRWNYHPDSGMNAVVEFAD